MATKRKYELKERARRQQETRRRITAATVALHETVGPARTQVSEIARHAGVERLTVYKHFPDQSELFRACRSHWEATHPAPDPGEWRGIRDPRRRTRTALRSIYGYFEDNQGMLENVLRDAESMPLLRKAVEEGSLAYLAGVRDVVVGGWQVGGRRRARLATVVELALHFHTWRFLARERGLTNDEAAELMVNLIACTAAP